MKINLPDKFEKRPQYKIGDVVVYKRTRDDEYTKFHQSKIIESWGLLDGTKKNDIIEWFYHTEETKNEDDDYLSEEDIMYRL